MRSLLPILFGWCAVTTTGCTKGDQAPNATPLDATVQVDGSVGDAPPDPLLTGPVPASSLRLTSTAFEAASAIPSKYSCQGEDISPPLEISGVPPEAQSLIVVVDDPDAPDPEAPEQDWIHWILFDLPASTNKLPEAMTTLPAAAGAGLNSWGKPTYGGPCPPKGRHRYFFRVHAVDRMLGLSEPSLDALRSAATSHLVGSATLMATYEQQ